MLAMCSGQDTHAKQRRAYGDGDDMSHWDKIAASVQRLRASPMRTRGTARLAPNIIRPSGACGGDVPSASRVGLLPLSRAPSIPSRVSMVDDDDRLTSSHMTYDRSMGDDDRSPVVGDR